MFDSVFWALPFAGIILSIAIGPLIAPRIWSQHYGKIIATWSFSLLILIFTFKGWRATYSLSLHALIDHYLPFIILIAGLYSIAGGIKIRIQTPGTPLSNTIFLSIGSLLSSALGTTGAAMILIRPFMEMNVHRNIRRHQIIFFIFSVANIGGSLTPIGDPPLFIGFLQGVPFFWTTIHLLLPFLVIFIPLMTIFYIVDSYFYRKEDHTTERFHAEFSPISKEKLIEIDGMPNILAILGVIALVIISSQWPQKVVAWSQWSVGDTIRNIGILVIALLSYKLTSPLVRIDNNFDWHPAHEIAKIFAGIFITVTPVIEMLKMGSHGSFHTLSAFLMPDGMPNVSGFFWITGALSAWLDNAPTYLVFFHFAGGDVGILTTTFAKTLTAISTAAVFMGALTYIGNAPNFMVKSIAEENGIKMPSFFGYMGWSAAFLLPLLWLVSLIFF